MKKLKITRTVYWFLLFVPIIPICWVVAQFTTAETYPKWMAITLIGGWLPPIIYLRMRYLGMSTKEMWLSLIPFYGLKYRYRRMFGKLKD